MSSSLWKLALPAPRPSLPFILCKFASFFKTLWGQQESFLDPLLASLCLFLQGIPPAAKEDAFSPGPTYSPEKMFSPWQIIYRNSVPLGWMKGKETQDWYVALKPQDSVSLLGWVMVRIQEMFSPLPLGRLPHPSPPPVWRVLCLLQKWRVNTFHWFSTGAGGCIFAWENSWEVLAGTSITPEPGASLWLSPPPLLLSLGAPPVGSLPPAGGKGAEKIVNLTS